MIRIDQRPVDYPNDGCRSRDCARKHVYLEQYGATMSGVVFQPNRISARLEAAKIIGGPRLFSASQGKRAGRCEDRRKIDLIGRGPSHVKEKQCPPFRIVYLHIRRCDRIRDSIRRQRWPDSPKQQRRRSCSRNDKSNDVGATWRQIDTN